jgi:hypothetical protein
VPARAAPLLVLLAALAACSRAPDQPSVSAAAASSQPGGAPVFSRAAFASPRTDAGAGEPAAAVPTIPEPAALDEILAAARLAGAADAGGADGGAPDRGALLGTDTGVPADAGAAEGGAAAEARREGGFHIGEVNGLPRMSSPAIEKAARAQLYWPLVQHCRDEAGGILPAEAVHVTLQIDREGYIVPATILAVPREPRFAQAARCMARELRVVAFRMPAASRGLVQDVDLDVPSVD